MNKRRKKKYIAKGVAELSRRIETEVYKILTTTNTKVSQEESNTATCRLMDKIIDQVIITYSISP